MLDEHVPELIRRLKAVADELYGLKKDLERWVEKEAPLHRRIEQLERALADRSVDTATSQQTTARTAPVRTSDPAQSSPPVPAPERITTSPHPPAVLPLGGDAAVWQTIYQHMEPQCALAKALRSGAYDTYDEDVLLSAQEKYDELLPDLATVERNRAAWGQFSREEQSELRKRIKGRFPFLRWSSDLTIALALEHINKGTERS